MINIKSIYNKVCNKVLNESSSQDAIKHEEIVATIINNYFKKISNDKILASRPTSSTRYSDIKIYLKDKEINDEIAAKSLKNAIAWIEVKKDHDAIAYNGSCTYMGSRWSSGSKTYNANSRFTYNKGLMNNKSKNKGEWQCLGGALNTDDTGKKIFKESKLSKKFSDILNSNFSDSKNKNLKNWLLCVCKFLNYVKDPERPEFETYFLKNKDTYILFYSVFSNLNNLSFLKNDSENEKLLKWLTSDNKNIKIKTIDLGDLLLVGGKQADDGRIGPEILNDFCMWFNTAKPEDVFNWPSKKNKNERAMRLIDFPQDLIDIKEIFLLHYADDDKAEKAAYIQTGDDFYGFRRDYNPLMLEDLTYFDDEDFFPNGIPGENYLQLSWHSNRTRTGPGYQFRIRPKSKKSWSKYSSKYSFTSKNRFPIIKPENIEKIINNASQIGEAEEDPSKKTIALVGGSFKPPHAGHFDMVEQYAKKADKVIVVISDPKKSIRTTKNGTVITPKMSKAIWDIYVNRYGLGNKVEVKISSQASPIAAIYDYIDNTLKDCNIILGASKKDNDFKRFAKAESYFIKEGRNDINVLDPETTAVEAYTINGKPISASEIRDNIDDPEIIKTMLPKKLNSKDIDSIISILSNEI